MGINWVGIVFGLGAVISMGYWTTDFLVVQRVLAAKDLRSAKLAPIIGAAFKMMVPFIVILPGLLGLALLRDPHTGSLLRLVPADVAWSPAGQAQGLHGYDEVLPLMLARYCGPGLLGLGITALIAGFMSGMAGNVSAFTTVWTYDIYGAFINKKASDESKVKMGRWVTIIGVARQYRHRLSGDACAKHHGLRAVALQLLHRSAVRHGHSRNALEACNSGGRMDRTIGGNFVLRWHVRLGQSRSHGSALRRAFIAGAGSGAEHVSGTLVLADLCDRHRRREPLHPAQT